VVSNIPARPTASWRPPISLSRLNGDRVPGPEEISFNQRYIDRGQLERLGVALGKSAYARYISDIARSMERRHSS
jgi:hypothetical protein